VPDVLDDQRQLAKLPLDQDTPFLNKEVQGKAVLTIVNGQIVYEVSAK
jgi:dihydroorotase-like cyclic amidohydrolase